MRTFITLVIFIAVIVVSFWFQLEFKQKLDTDIQTNTHFPDYFMENFTITSMNEQGLPEYSLKAKKMQHFADDDSAEFEQPFLTFDEPDSIITVQAKRAEYRKDKNIIHLYGKVIIQQTMKSNQDELSILTDYLKINTQSRIAETHKPARVVTNSAKLNSIGLTFDSIQGILKLKSQVKGIYETPH